METDYVSREAEGYENVMCSVCHKIESHITNFCPNCGAHMGDDSDAIAKD